MVISFEFSGELARHQHQKPGFSEKAGLL